MADHLKGVAEHAVIVDTTASEFVSDMYGMWLGKGVHVVTPNKKVGSGDLKRWKACVEAMAETGAKWGDETTVGAGLPILNILRTDLINTGDVRVRVRVRVRLGLTLTLTLTLTLNPKP